MAQKTKVKMCFGKYGEKEFKDCNGDCEVCSEKETSAEIIFCEKKKTFPCDTLCRNAKLCRICYFGWYKKRVVIKEFIKRFMDKNKLIFERRKEVNNG